MDLDVRNVTADELPEFCRAIGVGFLSPSKDAQAEADARREAMYWDRTWAALDGDRMVATLRSFPVQLTVPGGAELAGSAITAVTTTSTHRRRGLATRIVTAELTAAQRRGEAVAVLHASEWPIYGRFGFGPATSECTLVIDSSVARLRIPGAGNAELVDREMARTVLPIVYAEHRAAHPGEISRDERFYDIDLGIIRYPSWGEMKPGFHVVVRDAGGREVGMARYEIEERWEQGRPCAIAKSDLFVAANAEGAALLWHHLLSIDLVTEIRVEVRSVADPLPFLLINGRHVYEQDHGDSLWVRLLDVPKALATRSYLTSGRVVLEVTDGVGLAGGRFEVTSENSVSACTRTGAAADLTIDIATLGTVYLGGHSLGVLHEAGLVAVHRPSALAEADAMFRSAVTPWCSTRF